MKNIYGAGLGFRREMLKELLPTLPSEVDFWEVAPENWIPLGGRYQEQFQQASSQAPFTTHGLSLSIGSSDKLDVEFVKTVKRFLDANNIAITGSSGKTSVKELTGFCLSKLAKTYFSKNSFNNRYGVPLSIFNTPQDTKFTVLEVGMDKKGEIDSLTKLIKPNLGLITNISYAHIENFKNLNKIAQTKGEVINNITPGGTMVINRDDKYYNYFLNKAKNHKLKIITFSKKNKSANVVFLSQKKNKK